MRDFYWLVKVFSRLYEQKGDMEKNVMRLVAEAVDINFSGIYSIKLSFKLKKENEEEEKFGGEVKNLKFRSNRLMKQIFRDKMKEFNKEFKFSDLELFLHRSKVLTHVDRSLSDEIGRYLLLFLDKPLTAEILLNHLRS